MLNIIKADLFRLFRGKGLYITTCVFLALIFLQIVVGASGSVGVMVTDSSLPLVEEVEAVLTGRNVPFKMFTQSDSLLYFVLPFIIFIAGADFSNGTAKNILTNGTSRKSYYLAKLLLSIAFATLILVFSIIIPIIIATIMNGFGGEFNLEFVSSVMKIFLPQLLMFIAVTCIGVFLMISTKRVATTNSIYIAFLMVPIIIILILTTIYPSLSELMKYDVPLSIRLLADPDITDIDLYRSIGLGLFYIITTTCAGLFFFEKSDIK